MRGCSTLPRARLHGACQQCLVASDWMLMTDTESTHMYLHTHSPPTMHVNHRTTRLQMLLDRAAVGIHTSANFWISFLKADLPSSFLIVDFPNSAFTVDLLACGVGPTVRSFLVVVGWTSMGVLAACPLFSSLSSSPDQAFTDL